MQRLDGEFTVAAAEGRGGTGEHEREHEHRRRDGQGESQPAHHRTVNPPARAKFRLAGLPDGPRAHSPRPMRSPCW